MLWFATYIIIIWFHIKRFTIQVNDIISLYINITDPVFCLTSIHFNTDIALQADLCITACTFQSFHHVFVPGFRRCAIFGTIRRCMISDVHPLTVIICRKCHVFRICRQCRKRHHTDCQYDRQQQTEHLAALFASHLSSSSLFAGSFLPATSHRSDPSNTLQSSIHRKTGRSDRFSWHHGCPWLPAFPNWNQR